MKLKDLHSMCSDGNSRFTIAVCFVLIPHCLLWHFGGNLRSSTFPPNRVAWHNSVTNLNYFAFPSYKATCECRSPKQKNRISHRFPASESQIMYSMNVRLYCKVYSILCTHPMQGQTKLTGDSTA